MTKDPKQIVQDLAQRVGKHDARRLLVNAGLSTSTAEKLVGGRYHSEIQHLVKQAILQAVAAAEQEAS